MPHKLLHSYTIVTNSQTPRYQPCYLYIGIANALISAMLPVYRDRIRPDIRGAAQGVTLLSISISKVSSSNDVYSELIGTLSMN